MINYEIVLIFVQVIKYLGLPILNTLNNMKLIKSMLLPY